MKSHPSEGFSKCHFEQWRELGLFKMTLFVFFLENPMK